METCLLSIGSVSSRSLPPVTDVGTDFSTLSSISRPFSIIDLLAVQSSKFVDSEWPGYKEIISKESL